MCLYILMNNLMFLFAEMIRRLKGHTCSFENSISDRGNVCGVTRKNFIFPLSKSV